MKKAIIFIAVASFLLAPLAAASIEVIYPNGGEFLPQNSKCEIKWSAPNFRPGFKIVLLKIGGAPFGVIVTNLLPGTTSYLWPTGQTSNGMAPANQQYMVRVLALDDTTRDDSDGAFTITPEPTVKLLSPNGGEIWTKFSKKNITWKAEYFTGTVKLELWWDNGCVGTITSAAPAADGKFEWEVGKIVSGGNNAFGVGQRFRVSVRASADPCPMDKGDGPFSIVLPRSDQTTPVKK